MDNEQIVQLVLKSISTQSGGQMNTQQLSDFLQLGIEQSDFLKEIRVETGIATKLQLDLMGNKPYILRPGVEGTAPDAGDNITFDKRELIPREVVAHEVLTYSFLKKALGGSVELNPDTITKVEAQIQDRLSRQILADMVSLAWNGDRAAAAPTPNFAFLKCLDGIIKRAYEAESGVHLDTYANDAKLYDVFGLMLDELPNIYKQDPSRLRFYVSPKTRRKYKEQESVRNTVKGDDLRYMNVPVVFDDVPVSSVFAVPDGTICLTLPENIAIGYGMSMLVERQKEITKRIVNLVMSADADVNFAIGDAMVLYEVAE